MEIVFLIVGIIIGVATSFFVLKYKYQSTSSKLEERNAITEDSLTETKAALDSERAKVIDLSSKLSALNAVNNNLEQKLSEQKKELDELQSRFTKEFENLANRILEEKSQKFTEQNKSNLDNILTPLQERIKEFEKRVNEVYVNETKERASLAEQIRGLHELNQQMSKEANNLTRALKGDSKTQGGWGEFILESILEKSGLLKDREYAVQQTVKSEDGRNLRPDVIVNLPENKSMVIDSKVSLTAYEHFTSTDDEAERARYLKDHINSIRNHLKRLSPKEYQKLYGLTSLDFVLMFIPIEPAFALAVQNDPGLFYEAFEKNIVIVSPTTLLATLRTIASIWKQEKQNANALEIAKQSGELYDKFVGFVEDLISLGNNLKQTKDNYDKAMNKLVEGRGNLVGRAENIKQLGANTTKSIPDALLDRADNGEELSENKSDV
jgi:DNA recombination protein RmuC